ncbi:flagellar type III secretion system protein FlhB [Paracoccus bogoriensis]|uniref:flagellar type III secretion system protein FlhB n=1 Tax=Paracoccus bogoriensis TaxID=242065 RepID=UPI001C669B30|nr:flagellar type III secretion system protein FlhB [Paracoccus bogoriensis]MBW7055454.1 flagellar type III secretion system protein FlhB [Paracoccus bogoriensis]
MSDDKDDKQFDPTEQRLQKAREKGDVPRSTELTTAAMYLGAWVAFAMIAGLAVRQWLGMASRAMGAEGWPVGGVFRLGQTLAQNAGLAFVALACVPLLAIIASLFAQRAWAFSLQKLAFDFNRINPARNAGQKFGASGLVTFGISVGKAVLVCLGGWFLFASLLERIGASALTGEAWTWSLGDMLGRVLLLGLTVSVLFTVPDVAWKWFDHRRKNRMSRKEMQDEMKDSEGDPHMKAARRQRAVDLAMKQMLADVAKADVIIVNPTHYAVALGWQRGSGRAPVCVAKGTDEIAARIREKARESNVPIWSDPPCARAIHATVRVGEEVRREHFAAVAAAIRFAEKMRAKARRTW